MEGYQYDAYGSQTVFTPGASGSVSFAGSGVAIFEGTSGLTIPTCSPVGGWTPKPGSTTTGADILILTPVGLSAAMFRESGLTS